MKRVFYEKTPNEFFEEVSYFQERTVLLKMGLCGASISKNLTNKKKKYLKVTFCNPTESRHCKSSVNDTVYTEVFLESSLKWFLKQKL